MGAIKAARLAVVAMAISSYSVIDCLGLTLAAITPVFATP
jgi:hypothetical protein